MKRRKRRLQRRSITFGRFSDFILYLFSHPLRLTLFAAAGLIFAWVTVTKTLPFALASTAPDLALRLNPNNPEALVAKANEKRQRLLTLRSEREDRQTSQSEASGQTANPLGHLPEIAHDAPARDRSSEVEALKKEIADLALRAIENDPLNATAVRLLAETHTSPEQVRSLMEEAATRSRREVSALFYLLNDNVQKANYQEAVTQIDILFRTQPGLSDFLVTYLWYIARLPQGVAPVVDALSKQPVWRSPFFGSFARQKVQDDTPLNLMLALKLKGTPLSAKEFSPYIDSLIAKNQVDAAFAAWLSFLPASESTGLELLVNGGFENDPSGSAFDWRIRPGLNAIVEFVRLPQTSRRQLRAIFQSGRVSFPEVAQIVLLPAGHYRLEGRVRGHLRAKRGLRWEIRCLGPSQRVLGQTELLSGESEQWRVFSLEADVPQQPPCIGQEVRLFHDSRSPSEEFAEGEVWFADLKLERTIGRNSAEK